ncbi:MAG: helix-turn-helix domain-containing protein [Candidatus Nanopelagicales bacterium]
MAESAPTLIQSVQRALHLVEAVSARHGRARPKELARDLGLSLPTTYHLLRTLTHEGYLKRLDDGSYVIGPALLQVASQDRMAATLVRARPAMTGLRDELRSPVYLAAYVDGEINVVEIVDSVKAPSIDLWVGMHDSAHATALGKCILSALTDEERQDYLARHPLHALTRRTVTNRTVLESEIGRGRPGRDAWIPRGRRGSSRTRAVAAVEGDRRHPGPDSRRAADPAEHGARRAVRLVGLSARHTPVNQRRSLHDRA